MAGKKKSNAVPRFSEFSFINVRLDSADYEWLEAADVVTEFPVSQIFDLVEEGYKFSLALDEKNSSIVASLTDRFPDSDFKNHILSARGATAFDAWVALAYKHFRLADGDWSKIAGSGNGSTSRYG